MFGQFFSTQTDYLQFLHGTTYILLAAIGAVMRRRPHPSLPWGWLSVFAWLQAAGLWLHIAAPALNARVVQPLQIGALALSFVCLLEFGRTSQGRVDRRTVGRWIYLPLTLAALSGARAGPAGWEATMRYAFGLPGAWLSAWVFARLAAARGLPAVALGAVSLGFMLYGLAAGVVVPAAPLAPAHVVNDRWWAGWTGCSIEAVRAALVLLLCASLWFYHHGHQLVSRIGWRAAWSFHGLQLVAGLLAVLAGGWAVTVWMGNDADHRLRQGLRENAEMAAGALELPDLSGTNASPVDWQAPPPRTLCDRFQRIVLARPDIARVRLLCHAGLPEGAVGIEVSGANGLERHWLRPRPETEEPQGLAASWLGRTQTVGPYSDEAGLWLSAFAPVRQEATAAPAAVLALDMPAAHWGQIVRTWRLAAIGVTLLVSLLLVLFFVVRQRLWDSAQGIAASEARLAEAQSIAQIGNWTYVVPTGRLAWSRQLFAILGHDQQRFSPSYDALAACAIAEDRPALEQALRQAREGGQPFALEWRAARPDGTIRCLLSRTAAQRDRRGRVVRLAGTVQDITVRRHMEDELKRSVAAQQRAVTDLQNALTEVQTLRGLVPVCANCKRIRNPEGDWKALDQYVRERGDARFSHGLCPDCLQRLYPEATA